VIFPGIHTSMEALFERASMLHRVEIARPKSVIGKTTTAALQSGLLYGYAGIVDSMVERIRGELGSEARVVATGVERIRGELGSEARVVATGGLAHRVASESAAIERVEPFLTLEGLRLIFEKNRPSTDTQRKERPR
jgi:type III pantothenate kinase